jgi:hypothetical protein
VERSTKVFPPSSASILRDKDTWRSDKKKKVIFYTPSEDDI